jgi:hypothetical protein
VLFRINYDQELMAMTHFMGTELEIWSGRLLDSQLQWNIFTFNGINGIHIGAETGANVKITVSAIFCKKLVLLSKTNTMIFFALTDCIF